LGNADGRVIEPSSGRKGREQKRKSFPTHAAQGKWEVGKNKWHGLMGDTRDLVKKRENLSDSRPSGGRGGGEKKLRVGIKRLL